MTVLDLRFGFHHSTGLLINLDIFSVKSLVFKFGRLSMTVRTTHHGFKDVAMAIQQLGNLTSEDMKLLRRCRPGTLTVIDAQDGDEARLVDILEHNPRITEIHIRECRFRFALTIIDRMISKRTKAIQNAFLAVLRVFNVTSRWWKCDNVDLGAITATAQFTEGSFEYDMETNIEMNRCREYHNNDSFVCEFARQYGWSIKTLQVSKWLNDRFAMMLDESTQGRNSMIEHFIAIPTSLTTCGVDAMDRFIKRSQNFLSIELALEKLQDKAQSEKALLVLQRYKDRLTHLVLIGTPAGSWLPQLAQAFPSKNNFPRMESFTMEQHSYRRVSKGSNAIIEEADPRDHNSIAQQWIVSLVSAPAQPSLPLKTFVCRGIFLRPWYWEAIILATDFSALEMVAFEDCGFEQEQLELLVDHIADNYHSPLPLKQLSVGGCIGIEALEAKLRQSAPNAHISGDGGWR
ncbi:hypothetical protein BGX34_007805 [Mortierella sp. NVP85]|nr:hypothetical protein BGX34_007805 [Mortierella sp. NVP85]